ncbi:hypothetical protein B2J93_2293 [Marssonina coronariae]|uniref:Uncharacterized protein n=1 Tax=Diplocarpon coronariae TaxID=2795749 RepID=A0A218YUD4_9HELO|nr:hypothetical protein B2J93_2293 [Marssonina coronariae]
MSTKSTARVRNCIAINANDYAITDLASIEALLYRKRVARKWQSFRTRKSSYRTEKQRKEKYEDETVEHARDPRGPGANRGFAAESFGATMRGRHLNEGKAAEPSGFLKLVRSAEHEGSNQMEILPAERPSWDPSDKLDFLKHLALNFRSPDNLKAGRKRKLASAYPQPPSPTDSEYEGDFEDIRRTDHAFKHPHKRPKLTTSLHSSGHTIIQDGLLPSTASPRGEVRIESERSHPQRQCMTADGMSGAASSISCFSSGRDSGENRWNIFGFPRSPPRDRPDSESSEGSRFHGNRRLSLTQVATQSLVTHPDSTPCFTGTCQATVYRSFGTQTGAANGERSSLQFPAPAQPLCEPGIEYLDKEKKQSKFYSSVASQTSDKREHALQPPLKSFMSASKVIPHPMM